MDGFETVRYIREVLKSDVPVFFVTGEIESDETLESAKKHNIRSIIPKPLEVTAMTTLFLQCGLINPISP